MNRSALDKSSDPHDQTDAAIGDKTALNEAGKTSMEIAIGRGHYQLAELLRA